MHFEMTCVAPKKWWVTTGLSLRFKGFGAYLMSLHLGKTSKKNCRKSVIGIIYPYESEKFAQVYCNTFVVTFQCSEISLTLYESKQDETKHDKSNTQCK